MIKLKGLYLTIFMLLYSLTSQDSHPIMEIARRYLGTPYVANTLEDEGSEELVINKQEVDCTTFVEYVLAEYFMDNEHSFESRLQSIRYRNGIIKGYTSRMHYFSEWMQQAIKNELLIDVTAKNSNFIGELDIHFMSSHPELYKPLQYDSEYKINEICKVEKELTGDIFHYLPKDKIGPHGVTWIQEGDIIALVTTIDGLDVSHLGFATYEKKELRLLHASFNDKQVIIDSEPLHDKLKNRDSIVGIRVFRVQL